MMANKHLDCALEGDLMAQITALRKASGLTQVEVAAKLGCTNAAVCQWESGINYPLTFGRWQKLAKAVGAKMIIELEN